MRLDDLRALLSVVEHGSFQAAAQALDVPRTKLRRQLQGLEQEVGAPLLHRESRGARLTVAGEQVAERAGALLAAAGSMVDAARAANGAALGRLRMIGPVGAPPSVRARALVMLQTLHPGIALDVVEVDEPLTRLRTPFDLMLHLGPPPNREGWFSRVVTRLRVRLAASADYLAEHGAPRDAAELVGHRLLTWRAAGRFAEAWPLLDGGEVPIAPGLISANPELLGALAGQGGGIALLPGPPELFRPDGPELVEVLGDVVGAEVELRVLSPHPSRSDPRLRALLENVQRLVDGLSSS